MITTRTKPNPAKMLLKRYRMLIIQQEALAHSLQAAWERATSCTAQLKSIGVQGGSGAYDRMAEDVARFTDEADKLRSALSRISDALMDILAAIDNVPDETQRAVLTLRYVEGLSWGSVTERLHYERRQVFILHGRALWHVNQWLAQNEQYEP